ncbi:MAG TPA: DnaJ domain-containing protein [Candidatus Polarisedimenticolaceae bacterium]|nr:DnaJ domain-containing protein [Candidatus Polarisedimenticolaceae bacterium]
MTVSAQLTTAIDRGLARRAADRALERASGILTARRGKLKRLLCLERGELTHVASNLIEEQFTEFLVRHDYLPPKARARATVEARQAGLPLVTLLLQQGVLSAELVRRASAEQARSLLFASLEWTDGEYAFEAGTPSVPAEQAVRLALPPLILQHAAQYPVAIDRVRIRIGPPNLTPAVVPERKPLLQGIELGTIGAYLLEHCDGSVPVAALVERSPEPPEITLRTLHALLQLGVLEPVQAWTTRTVKDAVTRDECLARLELAATATHYGVLGIDTQASADEVRRSYYVLARRLHPDRFRSGPLKDLLARMEGYFTKVTEAYNTLADPRSRGEYDEQLAAGATEKKVEAQEEKVHLAKQNFLHAKSLAAKNRLQEAVRFLENAVQLDPAKAAYHLELGRLLTGNPRRRVDAERALLKATELEPALADGYFALAQLYERAGRTTDAAGMLREALRWDPAHGEAAEMLRTLEAGS